MNYWLILLILGTIALVVGPVMMFKPSARDQRLAALRQSAAEKGIGVRFVSEKASPNGKPLIVYSKPLVQPESTKGQWLLLRSSLSHEVNFYKEWDWGDKTQKAPQHNQQQLSQMLGELGDNIWGVELTTHSVGLWWDERQLTLDEIESLLDEVKAVVVK